MFERLAFGFGRRLPLILQTEASECGLACLGMIAGYYGYHIDLMTLRRQFSVSLKGTTLRSVIHTANQMRLAVRPVRLELTQLSNLKLPCILHWNFNHFVVLKEIGARSVTIHDPAFGLRRISLSELSRSFTGVAVELWPSPEFVSGGRKERIRLRRLLGHVSGLYRSFGQILLLAAALEVFVLVGPFFLQWIIDNVLVSGDRDLLTMLALGFGTLVLLQQAISAVRGWALMYVSTMLNIQWRANAFTHLLGLPTSYFEKRHLGDVVSRFGSIDTIESTLTNSFLEAVLDGVMSMATLVLMFVYSRELAWISVGAMLLYALGRWLWYRPLRTATEEQIVHAAKQQTHFLETVRGVRTIQLFQRHDERRASWLSLVVDQVNAGLRTRKLALLYQTLNGVLFGLENVIVIWLGARLVMAGDFTVGLLMAFSSYRMQFDSRVGALIDKFVAVQMLHLQGERLADILLTPTAVVQPAMGWMRDGDPEASLEVVGVRFRYAEQEPYVLDNVSLRVEPGESVAIVGPSGGGKSTLVSVMLGLLPPTEGEIRVGGQSVAKAGLDTLRQMVGAVLQDDVLFAGTLAENISFFDSNPDAEWIVECARTAALHQDIESMPMRYNTMVGDMGTVLSGGQKQRVLLARALYKRPKILFLDEATSHLDVELESIVNSAVKSLKMTRIIVAHRPQTIASVDRVVVLAGGRLVEHVKPRDIPAMRGGATPLPSQDAPPAGPPSLTSRAG